MERTPAPAEVSGRGLLGGDCGGYRRPLNCLCATVCIIFHHKTLSRRRRYSPAFHPGFPFAWPSEGSFRLHPCSLRLGRQFAGAAVKATPAKQVAANGKGAKPVAVVKGTPSAAPSSKGKPAAAAKQAAPPLAKASS